MHYCLPTVNSGEVGNTNLQPISMTQCVLAHPTVNPIRDYRYKHTKYAVRGIAEYWIIDPEERQIVLCQWVDGQYEDTVATGDNRIQSEVMPSFDLSAEQVLTMGSSTAQTHPQPLPRGEQDNG